jgi:hypothetical protein
MDINDPAIAELKGLVAAAREEFDLATAFHETWKPAAFDADLHARMGKSYASHAFLACRTALRREMLLALVRMWDSDKRSVRMTKIAELLRDKDVIEALAVDRVSGLGLPGSVDAMRADLQGRAHEVIRIVASYLDGCTSHPVLKHLCHLRHERLAHRQVTPSAVAAGPEPVDADIEAFVKDNARLVQVTAYDLSETAQVYRRYASEFWAGTRGEKTEGHPHYRPLRTIELPARPIGM